MKSSLAEQFKMSLEDLEVTNGAEAEVPVVIAEPVPDEPADIAEVSHDIDNSDIADHADAITEAREAVDALIEVTDTGLDVTENLTNLAASLEALCASGDAHSTVSAALFVSRVNHEFGRLTGEKAVARKYVPSFESLEDHVEQLQSLITSTADGVIEADTSAMQPEAPAPAPVLAPEDQPAAAELPVAEAAPSDVSGVDPLPTTETAGDPTPAEQASVAAVVEVVEGQDLALDPDKDIAAETVAPVSAAEMNVAVEGLISTVGRLGAKLVDNLRKVGKAIADHFAAVFSGMTGLKRRAFAIKTKAKTAKGDAAHNKITVGGLHRLALNGQVDSGSILKGLSNTVKVTDFVFDGYLKSVGNFYNGYATYLSKAERDIRVSHSSAALHEGIVNFAKAFEGESQKSFGAHANDIVFSGDRQFTLTSAHYPAMKKRKGAPSVTSKQETETLTAREIIAIADAVGTLTDKFHRYDEAFLQVLAAREKALNDAYKLIEDGKSDIGQGSAGWMLIGFAGGFINPLVELGEYTFTTMRAALTYAERSLKEYSAA